MACVSIRISVARIAAETPNCLRESAAKYLPHMFLREDGACIGLTLRSTFNQNRFTRFEVKLGEALDPFANFSVLAATYVDSRPCDVDVSLKSTMADLRTGEDESAGWVVHICRALFAMLR